MGSGDVGTPWMCTNNTSTTSQEIVPETGLVVRTLAFNDFRKRLVIHFKKQWERKEILWPSRTGNVEWVLNA
jgi:hypothetical protein